MSRGPGVGWRRAAVIVAAAVLAYANSLHGPFIWDDALTVVQNQQIREWRLPDVLTPERELPVAGRPLVNVTFAVNYALGGLSVTGYHAVNVALHVACALVLFGLLRRTLSLPTIPWPERRRRPPALGDSASDIALVAALLWGVHPLNTEAVNYVTQRTELMMALFYLLTLYASLRAIAPCGEPFRLAGSTAVIACAAGMACKESMVTAPVMVVLFDATLVFGSLSAAVRARWRFYASLALTWVVLGALLASDPRPHSAGLASGSNPWTYLLNQPEVITQYLRRALWPQGLIALYGWPTQMTIAQMWPYGVLIVVLLAATFVAFVKRPALGFLGAWFFVTLAPASSIVPIATEVGAERRMYLPLMGLVVLAVIGAWRAFKAWREPLWLATGLVIVALGATTFARNRDYASPAQLARTSLDARPNDLSRHFLGVALINAGKRAEGIAQLRRATATDPRAYYDLGMAYYAGDQLDEAVAALDTFAQREPKLLEVVTARLTMARVFARKKDWPRTIEQSREALRMNPAAAAAREMLVASLGNHGIALVGDGHLAEAIGVFREAVRLNPANPDTQRNLAVAYFDSGDMTQAEEHAKQGLALRPSDEVMRDVLAKSRGSRGPE